MSDYQFIPNLAAVLEEITADTIVSKTLYRDGVGQAILFGFAPGQALSEHTTPMAATIQIVAGTASITLGEDAFTAEAGCWIQMPPRLPHSVRADAGPLVMLLTMVKVA